MFLNLLSFESNYVNLPIFLNIQFYISHILFCRMGIGLSVLLIYIHIILLLNVGYLVLFSSIQMDIRIIEIDIYQDGLIVCQVEDLLLGSQQDILEICHLI